MHKKVKQIIKDNEVIGRRYYESLKAKLSRIDQNNTDDLVMFRKYNKLSVAEAEAKIQAYEEKHRFSLEPSQKLKDYIKSLYKANEPKEKEITEKWLWQEFQKAFFENEGVVFKTTPEAVKNLKPVFYYFLGDAERMRQCENVSRLSKVDLRKGILLVGDNGNGKTSILSAFEKVFYNSNMTFKTLATNEIVGMFEACETPNDKSELMKLLTTGTRHFDDLKAERLGSNYSKGIMVMREVLEIRDKNNRKTHGSMNYKETSPNNLKDALYEYLEIYGKRNEDRIYKNFIIIEFEGESFRG